MSMEFQKLFWEASLNDLKNGYTFIKEEEKYICLCCAKEFEDGIIYNVDGTLMNAKKAIINHINNSHNSMYDYLINMDKKYTGITDVQKNLMKKFYDGLSDKEIANKVGVSASTIRNQRFTLKEKAKQAKFFLGIIELLEEKKSTEDQELLIPIHRTATNIDERYATTESEREEFIKKYFEGKKLITFPNKQKRIIVVLQEIIKNFKENEKYRENEVNDILKEIYYDYVTIRRYLIEYGFLDRTIDCHEYWRKI
jgi:DNA-binding CsgD family transcriptional regulator